MLASHLRDGRKHLFLSIFLFTMRKLHIRRTLFPQRSCYGDFHYGAGKHEEALALLRELRNRVQDDAGGSLRIAEMWVNALTLAGQVRNHLTFSIFVLLIKP